MGDVYQVGYGEKDEAVEVLSAAFYDYPVMEFVLNPERPGFDERLRALVSFFCEVRFLRDWPVLGVRDGDRLAAAALANSPVKAPTLPEVKEGLKALGRQIGQGPMERITAYEEACAGLEPEAPHYYLGMIGVLPEYQGKGYGRLLLEYMHEMADNDPEATGVCLNTERDSNVPLYRHFGYEVIGERVVGPLHTRCMFRKTAVGRVSG